MDDAIEILRGKVKRGELGCGPETAELVRELLAGYDRVKGRYIEMASQRTDLSHDQIVAMLAASRTAS